MDVVIAINSMLETINVCSFILNNAMLS